MLFTPTWKTISYIIKYSITLIHCHLILLYLHFIAGLKYISLRVFATTVSELRRLVNQLTSHPIN